MLPCTIMDNLDQALFPIQADVFFPADRPPATPLWSHEAHSWTPTLVTHYLEAYSAPGDLVLDPFAAQASLPLAMAGSRRRALLSHFSPTTLLALLTSAATPDRALLDAVFSRVADAARRGRTLADHLRSLYETVCPVCAQTASAAYFVWDRAAGEPVEKGYACPHCQSAGQTAADMADGELAAGLEVRGAAYWGLLSRLVAPGDASTGRARALLDLYTPRALLAIGELITAAEQRLAEPDQIRVGRALILHALERCIVLPDRPGPRRLRPAARFVEHNVWLAFEEAYRTLRARNPTSFSSAPDLPTLLGPEGEGCALLLGLAVPGLATRLEPGSVTLILSQPPPLDPSLYPLSFLWGGWLYGRETADRLKSLLKARTMDRDWYARALAVSLRTLATLLRPGGHLVFAFSDETARRALALLAAAAPAGLRLAAQATQAPLLAKEGRPAWRLVFATRGSQHRRLAVPALADALRQSAQETARQLVHLRGESASLPLLYTACAARWDEAGLLAQATQNGQGGQAGRRPVSFLAQQLRLGLATEMPPSGLRFHDAGSGQFLPQWGPEQPGNGLPLADRVEQQVVDLLAAGKQPIERIEAQVYARFPGWETPDAALLTACLASYARQEGDVCRLRPEDETTRRARERGEMLLRLHELGYRLGYNVWVAPWEQEAALGLVPLGRGGPAQAQHWAPAGLVWHEAGRPAYAYALALRAALHPWLQPLPGALGGCPRYVVLPGGRAGLLDFKLRRCPAWRAWLAETGWEFVKFRHVRRLAALSDLDLNGFRARIGLDPIASQPGEQLALFGLPVGETANVD